MTGTRLRVALNLEEAAAACGVKPATLKAAVAAGQLRAKRSKRDTREGREGDGVGLYLFAPAELERWFDGLADA